MRSRRHFLATLSLGALAASFASFAQPQSVRRIGILTTAAPEAPFPRTLPDRLRRLGYEEGRNLAIEWRYAAGNNDRLPALAQELARLKPELIVAHNNESIAAIKQATRSIPVVMHTGWLPVEHGFVDSLARPGGNITGAVWIGIEQTGKVLETLKAAVPNAVRVAMTWNPTLPFSVRWKAENDRAASLLGMTAQYFEMTRLDEVGPALERIATARPDALCIGGDAIAFNRASEIAAFAIEHKLVTISNISVFADRGALLTYGPDLSAIFDRTASFPRIS